MEAGYQGKLKQKIKEYVHLVYDVSKNFPRDELYGITSQLRSASMSVLLNCVEGYARQSKAMFNNFLKISYGSLKESKILIEFANEEGFKIEKERLEKLQSLADELGAMIWKIINK